MLWNFLNLAIVLELLKTDSVVVLMAKHFFMVFALSSVNHQRFISMEIVNVQMVVRSFVLVIVLETQLITDKMVLLSQINALSLMMKFSSPFCLLNPFLILIAYVDLPWSTETMMELTTIWIIDYGGQKEVC